MNGKVFAYALILFFMTMFSPNSNAQNAPADPPIETGVSQTLAKWRAANYSDVRYKLNLTIEKMSPTLKGTIEVSVKSNADTIILDWRKIRGNENLSTVSNISVNGKSAKYEEINEHLVFKEGVKTGENLIKLDFTSPILTSGSAITRYVDKEDGAEYIYSLFVPSDASTAFPVFDQPDLKARFKLNAKVSRDWKVVSNTQPVPTFYIYTFGKSSKIDNSKNNSPNKNWEFDETKPISTYVFALAAGDFVTFSDKLGIGKSSPVELPNTPEDLKEFIKELANPEASIYVRKSQAEKFKAHEKEVFRLNREGVKFLESYFDYKFPFPKYDLVLIPEFPFGGMEHAGATFLRESSVIFPTEPTKNDYVSRANVIFHEAAHQWFGDTVTMKWFDDLWLKEGFAEFMAYKTLEKVMPEYNAWKIFYERNKQAAYLTDSTKGTTPIYQEIPNLSSAKSAYGNIVYRKAPSFLKQAEFYLGADKFQTAVRAFLKKYEFKNAEWLDLVSEFEQVKGESLKEWGERWIKQRGLARIKTSLISADSKDSNFIGFLQEDVLDEGKGWLITFKTLQRFEDNKEEIDVIAYFQEEDKKTKTLKVVKDLGIGKSHVPGRTVMLFPNYQDYGYGIFLLDQRSRDYVLKNIQNEKDDFLRTMLWGSLWDSVREGELNPQDYVALVIKNINVETDESTIQTLFGRVSTAMNYYLSDKQREEFAPQIEKLLLEKMQNAPTVGQKITFYRSFLSNASSENARNVLKGLLKQSFSSPTIKEGLKADSNPAAKPALTLGLPTLRTKDKFDIVTRLLILGDKDAPQLLAELEKTETSDEAKRYAYAAKAGIATAENKAKFWNDFTNNKEISESYIESAFAPFNSIRHSELTLPYLEKALAELPNLKRNRKIFFVNGWLGAFIGGQKSEEALQIVNKFLESNPNLDKDLRLKILENSDTLERAVKIRAKYKGD